MTFFPHYPNLEPQKIYQNFLSDVERSAKGEKTSLRWIINGLPDSSVVIENEPIQILVVGGTICKSAIVKKINESAEIISEIDIPKPSFPTAESFLAFVSSHIAEGIDTVVINAADTIKPVMENGTMDGIFLVSTKENKMEGLLGKKLGYEISEYYFNKFGRRVKINIANDTVCLLLSGLTKYNWQQIAGGILGTGLNIALFLDKRTVVNLEAGGYTSIISSEPGKEIDKFSEEPGEYLFEKETAGGYLYRHFNFWIKKEHSNFSEISSSAMLSELAQGSDKQIASLAQEILEYSATLYACQIAAIMSFLGRNTMFIMQGSLFLKGYRYRETVEKVVNELAPNLQANFVEITNADVLGAAKVVI